MNQKWIRKEREYSKESIIYRKRTYKLMLKWTRTMKLRKETRKHTKVETVFKRRRTDKKSTFVLFKNMNERWYKKELISE